MFKVVLMNSSSEEFMALPDLLQLRGVQVRRWLTDGQEDGSSPAVVLVDCNEKGDSDIVLDASVKWPYASIIAFVPVGSLRLAVEAIKAGAVEIIEKPWRLEDVCRQIIAIIGRLGGNTENDGGEGALPFLGISKIAREIRKKMKVFAEHDATVLVTGESGTGKEVVAQGIHRLSARSCGPFVAKNCGAIPSTLMENELFGCEKGAYTGAVNREGCFEAADGGVLFLDEVAELPSDSQAAFLRVIENKQVVRLGTNRPLGANVRIIAATNQDLRGSIALGRFRRDLFYRLNVLPLSVPPLRERKEDIPVLAGHFSHSMAHKPGAGISEAAVAKLSRHDWPGNVRELKNVLERAAVYSAGRGIKPEHIVFE